MTQQITTPPILHRLRKVEMVILAEDIRLLEDLLGTAGISGWTIIRDVGGMGHAGFHQARTLFNDQSGLVMFIAVASRDLVDQAVTGLATFLAARPGVMFASDVDVLRSEYFTKQLPEPAA